MADRVGVRVRRREGKGCGRVSGRCGDSGCSDGVVNIGRITSADGKKGRPQCSVANREALQVVVAGARRPGDGDGVVFDAAVCGGDYDCNCVVPFGQSHLMACGGAVGVGRQNGNRGLSMVGYGSHGSYSGGCGYGARVVGCAGGKSTKVEEVGQS